MLTKEKMLCCGTAGRCTKQRSQPIFCIFVQCFVYLFIILYFLYLFIIFYSLYLLIFLYLFVLWTAGRCIQQRLQPIVDIFALFFFLYLSIIFCIFSSYFIFNHYLLYLLVFGTAGRCIQQRLQPIVDDCRDNLFLAHKLLSLLCFMYYWWVILIIAVHISNVALKWKCSKTSGPLNSSFFAGGCYCTRGRRWHIAKEAKLQLVDIMQSIISEVQPKVARIQGIIVQQRLARSLHIGLLQLGLKQVGTSMHK